jgi:hypothetical protein
MTNPKILKEHEFVCMFLSENIPIMEIWKNKRRKPCFLPLPAWILMF